MPTEKVDCPAVSILVLLDDAYRLEERGQDPELYPRFQSLFFWMMPTGWRILDIVSDISEVSILVLLDDAYRPCFNPDLFIIPNVVSILVLLDDAYRLS